MEQEQVLEIEREGKFVDGNESVHVVDPKTKFEIDYSMSKRLKRNLDKKIIPSLQKKDKDCILVIDGGEGCLSGDTLIKTSKGDKMISELYNKKPFEVESLNVNTKEIEKGKAICTKSGIKQVFEIETEDGRKIKATSNHIFFVLREGKVYEVKLSELKEGDELICQ